MTNTYGDEAAVIKDGSVTVTIPTTGFKFSLPVSSVAKGYIKYPDGSEHEVTVLVTGETLAVVHPDANSTIWGS